MVRVLRNMFTPREMQNLVDQINNKFDELKNELDKLKQDLENLKPKKTSTNANPKG